MSRKRTLVFAAVIVALAAAFLFVQWQVGMLEQQFSGIERQLAAVETRLQQTETTLAAREATATALSAERQALASAPGRYIQSLEVRVSTRGILLFPSSRASSAVLRNTSRFNVSDMRGLVEYRDSDGTLLGSSAVQIEGTVLAGQTTTVLLKAFEVDGRADPAKSRILVERVTILGGE